MNLQQDDTTSTQRNGNRNREGVQENDGVMVEQHLDRSLNRQKRIKNI